MALQKPYMISIKGTTIDVNKENLITWQVSGDIQVAYKIDILSNLNNSLVWSSGRIVSYGLRHLLSPSILTNGNEYKLSVTIYNESNQSIISDNVIFQTSSTPIVTPYVPSTIPNASYSFSAEYSQKENVPLRNYTVLLYNADQQLIDKSPIKTIQNIEYIFNGLQTETNYYIEFQVVSTKGLIGTSGKIPFYCFYIRPKMNVNLQAKNIENSGMELSWYIVQIIGKSDISPIYIDNEKIDLRKGTITFDKGFNVRDNFSLQVWLENIPSKTDLLVLHGDNGKLRLQYDYAEKCFVLYKENDTLKDIFMSHQITGDRLTVLIQQQDFYMNLIAKIY